MKKIIAILLMLILVTLCVTSCKSSGPKLTEESIRNSLKDSEGEMYGTLTVKDGKSDNVKAFDYVIKDVSASEFKDKENLKTLLVVAAIDAGKLTMSELYAVLAISEAISVLELFCEDETSDATACRDDAFSMVCDGNVITYGDWKISATVDQKADSMTIKAICD